MGWKNWPYWLKGGLILVFIVIVLSLTAFIYDKIYIASGGYKGHGETLLGYLLLVLGLPIYIIAPTLGEGTFIFLIIVMYFIIGVILGWVIGKIKSKK